MPTNGKWSRDQLVIAIKLYCEIPFGKLHSRNPKIVQYAKMIGRSPSALAMKLTNFASLDPAITLTGRKGLSGASIADRAIWQEMTSDWDNLVAEARKAESSFSILDRRAEDDDETIQDAASYLGKTRIAEVEHRPKLFSERRFKRIRIQVLHQPHFDSATTRCESYRAMAVRRAQ